MKIFQASFVNPMEPMHDHELAWTISQCTAGNEQAIELLVRYYEEGVYRLALSVVGDPFEAREITQETFISALRSLKRYRERQSFKAWLYTIALNHSRSHLRKRKTLERLRATLGSLFRVELQKQATPEEAAIQNEQEARIWGALSRLDEKHRIVVELRYVHEFSIREIADVLAIREGTVHSRLHYARERLRDALEDRNGVE